MAENTEYMCDACGRTDTKADLFSPKGWFQVRGGPHWMEENAGYRARLACSPACLATLGRRLELDHLIYSLHLDIDDASETAYKAIRIASGIADKLPKPAAKVPAKKAAPRPRKAA